MKFMLLLMETFNHWRPEVDHFSNELSNDLKSLTSRIVVLEASHAPPSAPKREEEGWAMDLGIKTTPQGNDGGSLVLHQPLANGQLKVPSLVLAN
jgi:hypothetical protein